MQLAFAFGNQVINTKAEKAVTKNRKTVETFFKFREEYKTELTNYPASKLKKLHGLRGKKALKALAKELGLAEFKVNYNPSGIIDAGYLTLIGLWEENNGIYISLSCGLGELGFLYRSVKHMQDWTGGSNNFLYERLLYTNFDYVLEKLYELRRCN